MIVTNARDAALVGVFPAAMQIYSGVVGFLKTISFLMRMISWQYPKKVDPKNIWWLMPTWNYIPLLFLSMRTMLTKQHGAYSVDSKAALPVSIYTSMDWKSRSKSSAFVFFSISTKAFVLLEHIYRAMHDLDFVLQLTFHQKSESFFCSVYDKDVRNRTILEYWPSPMCSR